MQKFIKFGVFSGGGWLLDCGLLLFLTQSIGTALYVANFISSSIAALTVFTFSRLLIFQPSKNYPVIRTLIYFCYTCGIIVMASTVITPIAWLLQHTAQYFLFDLTKGNIAFLAKVLITPPQLLLNFFMSRYLAENRILK